MPIGERIAIYRRRRGLTQLVLAGLIGRSESWLSQVERGIRPIDRLSVLIDIAHVLKVNVTDLTGQPFSLAPNGSFQNDAVRAIRRALTRYDAIPAILDPARDKRAPAPDVASLQRHLQRAWRLRQAARYSELGTVLPRLMADTERATRELEGIDRLAAFAVLTETYHVTAMALKKFGENELAWIAADRGVLAAERAEAPLLLAVSARAVGQVFMSAGRLDEAESVSAAALTALEPWLGSSSPEHLSVSGALLLTRAIIAARKGDRPPSSSSGKPGLSPTGWARTEMTSGPSSGRPTWPSMRCRSTWSLAIPPPGCARRRASICLGSRRSWSSGASTT